MKKEVKDEDNKEDDDSDELELQEMDEFLDWRLKKA